ncbi:quinone-dependent dihydroorotate dehydrogenase [Allobranchiibius sp. GilTou38]|uniref:quinone-dependent dihydroorotate dehydrogenase n=1 Tax=Allobranchiibius sp. GilTou38 TaxID=2815210 RepID=UPI0032607068
MDLLAKTMEAGYTRVLRPVLFRSEEGDPEAAHHKTLQRLSTLAERPRVLDLVRRACAVPTAPVNVAGITFPGKVGLAAGVDKDGLALKGWSALGFSHIEVGTVTPLAQPGNDKPRLFRVYDSTGIINRMGFNNDGVEALATRLRAVGPLSIPVGVSIGKNKSTPVDDAVHDYLMCLRTLDGLADYIAVNVSSPNTAGLRGLQGREPLGELLATLVQEATQLAQARSGDPVPIFVKIAPDLKNEAIDDILEVAGHADIAGIVATNTTLSRDGLRGADLALVDEEGGLSGSPLTRRTRRIVRYVAEHSVLPVIGVGGVMSVTDGKALIDAGAALVQVYTGFVYSGPSLVRDLNRALG